MMETSYIHSVRPILPAMPRFSALSKQGKKAGMALQPNFKRVDARNFRKWQGVGSALFLFLIATAEMRSCGFVVTVSWFAGD